MKAHSQKKTGWILLGFLFLAGSLSLAAFSFSLSSSFRLQFQQEDDDVMYQPSMVIVRRSIDKQNRTTKNTSIVNNNIISQRSMPSSLAINKRNTTTLVLENPFHPQQQLEGYTDDNSKTEMTMMNNGDVLFDDDLRVTKNVGNDFSEKRIVPLRDEATKRLAQRCVQAGQGGVCVKHFRKAGGTSISDAIRKYACGRTRRIPSYASEFPFFNTDTFHSLNSTIFITTMRHPIDRIISLYWFEGRWPRTCGKACEDSKIKNDENKVADLDQWIEHVHDQTNHRKLNVVRHNACGQWSSVENYYTRILLGVDAVQDRNQKRQTKNSRGFLNVTLTREHLHRAKEILASFDLVMIQEQMMGQSQSNRMFHEITAPPNSITSDKLANKRKGAERAKYYQPPSNATLERLRELNALDIELYEYAVKLSAQTVKRWAKTRDEEERQRSSFDAAKSCQIPPLILPDDIFDIALGGNFCCGGKYSPVKERERGFWYFGPKTNKCTLHSDEADFL